MLYDDMMNDEHTNAKWERCLNKRPPGAHMCTKCDHSCAPVTAICIMIMLCYAF